MSEIKQTSKPWSEATLKAWNESCEHWERLATGTAADYEFIYGNDCALCAIFVTNKECKGCPVAEAGFPRCSMSPWGKVHNFGIGFRGSLRECKANKQFQELAANQLAFLKSLRPK